MINLATLTNTINISSNYEVTYDASNDMIQIQNIKHPYVQAYIMVDDYTPGNPLEITNDSYVTDTRYDKQTTWNAQNWGKLIDLTDYYQIGILDGLNELVIDTTTETINRDLTRYLECLTSIDKLYRPNEYRKD